MSSVTPKVALLTGAATALCLAAAPAAAQTVVPDSVPPGDAAVAEVAPPHAEERLIALSVERSDGKGHIRPFAGGILPNAGTIRSFAGPITGTAGTIRSFQGELTGSAGTIRSFAGTIRSFAGTIRSFSDSVNPLGTPDPSFWGTLAPQSGSLSASAGTIRSFNGDLEVMAGTIRSFVGDIRGTDGTILSYAQAPATYTGIRDQISALVDKSRLTFGTAVLARTGQSFDVAFTAKMLGKYGIDLNNPASIYGLNEVGFELFLLDWHDNLMMYSGQDQVDHWMQEVSWTPALTQNLGAGAGTKIGVLDFAITGDDFANVTNSTKGYTAAGVHGSAVTSLIAAKHDGRGVMGIAPGATVFGYNPFDITNTAGWTDVKAGVKYLLDNGASVINMSLGVSGYTLNSGWNDSVFSPNDKAFVDKARKAVFILAAGNDGITQTVDQKINWNFATNPNIIVVGSVAPDGTISEFSNRPGDATFTVQAGVDPLGTNKLRDRFVVASGEWMLVSDGQGGVTRMSGTSFAAPLVSGTIALVHDRWPWLKDNPADTVNLILNSTDDLGAPGTDDVYGRGRLNVAKALAPGNFWAMKYSRYVDGVKKDMSAATVLETSSATLSSWTVASNVYFSAFEDIGTLGDSYRDFNIPIAAKLVGQTVGTTGELFDSYVQGRFVDWMNANRRTAPTGPGAPPPPPKFETAHFSSPAGKLGGLDAEAIAVPRTWRPGLRQSTIPFDTGMALRSPDGRFAMRFGSGAGAGFIGQQGFAMQSDYDVLTGGANPFMGLASGGSYGAVEMMIGDRVTVSTGVSQQEAVLDYQRMTMRERQILGGMDPYRATANDLKVTYRATPKLTTSFSYTLLNEDSAMLGVRSIDSADMMDGTSTDAATFGADYAVTKGLSLAVSGTVGRTRSGGSQGMRVSDGGIASSAWQVALAKQGVLDGHDRVRLTFAQPLHIEHGSVDFAMAAVIDRQTGEIGEIVKTAEIGGGRRRFVAEAIYGRDFTDGSGGFNLFGRANLRSDEQSLPSVTLGGSLRLGF